MDKNTLRSAMKEIILSALRNGITDKDSLSKIKNNVCQKYGINTFPDAELLSVYRQMIESGEVQRSDAIERLLQKRGIRTLSGISPVSVLMPPAPCKSACVYCPTERANAQGKTLFQLDTEKKYGIQKIRKKYQRPGALVMPKSYISSEPGAMRALLAGFDPLIQISRRLTALKKTGHSPEKSELIVQGGTFSDLPKAMRTRFITRCYQAFNRGSGNTEKGTRSKEQRTESKNQKSNENNLGSTLREAQKINETAEHRVVGLTLETRPGSITPDEIREFRRLGCTRVEIGVQTLDDEITKKTKRIQTREQVVRGTRLLRQAGFKICYHIMPGLPFSTPEKDIQTYREICENPDFCPDLVKIYPCSVVPFSELEHWYRKGEYIPYSDDVLFELLKEMKQITPPWMRISRLVRDIPGTAILGGSKTTNLRQLIQEQMHREGKRCRCIRCREVRDETREEEPILRMRTYQTGGGTEYFLSYEWEDETLHAMLRLFLPNDSGTAIFRALKNAAIIRELHTYGRSVPLGKREKKSSQHIGLGARLVREAERITQEKGFSRLAVISGIGVKQYYRDIGFFDEGTYLVKKVS
jgi:elongator complex protein 3